MDTTPVIKGPLKILYQDEYLVAINKPAGLVTHRSKMTNHASQFALQMLRDQLGQKVFPAHRLDRKTSGVLLFSLDNSTASMLQTAFENQKIDKEYIAVVRGKFPDEITVDHDVLDKNERPKAATTQFERLAFIELAFQSDRYPRSRYSLIKALPQTGRMHQIRKHCSHINHPIIGDRPHGCNKQNKYFKENYGLTQMFLHARGIRFNHPIENNPTTIKADFPEHFRRIFDIIFPENPMAFID